MAGFSKQPSHVLAAGLSSFEGFSRRRGFHHGRRRQILVLLEGLFGSAH